MAEPYPCDDVQILSLGEHDQLVCVLDEGHEGAHMHERIGDEP